MLRACKSLYGSQANKHILAITHFYQPLLCWQSKLKLLFETVNSMRFLITQAPDHTFENNDCLLSMSQFVFLLWYLIVI